MSSVLDATINRMFPENCIKESPKFVATRKERLANADPALFANAALSLTRFDDKIRQSTRFEKHCKRNPNCSGLG